MTTSGLSDEVGREINKEYAAIGTDIIIPTMVAAVPFDNISRELFGSHVGAAGRIHACKRICSVPAKIPVVIIAVGAHIYAAVPEQG